jgi:hypothetical protein
VATPLAVEGELWWRRELLKWQGGEYAAAHKWLDGAGARPDMQSGLRCAH